MSESSPVKFAAVLLAAGHSIRMRRDKALLERDGRLMWERQLDVLRTAGATEVFLSARPDQPWAEKAEGFDGLVRDSAADAGPLGGIVAALAECPQSHLAVLAVDLPQMEPEWFTQVRALCGEGIGAVGRNGKFYEPLAAFYPRELLPLAQGALERRELSLQKLLATGVKENRLCVREINASEVRWFANWNEA